LYFSTPQHFNDPIDSLFYVDKKQFLHTVEQEIITRMDNFVDQELKSDDILFLPDEQLAIGAERREILDVSLNISKNPVERKRFINEFVAPMLEYGVALAQKNLKVISLSEDPLSTVMWSHYAKNHSGFVVAYEKQTLAVADCFSSKSEAINGQKFRLEKIKYTDATMDLGGFLYHYLPARNSLNNARMALQNNTFDFPKDELYNALLTKMPDWAYEKEWRLIPEKIDLLAEDEIAFICVKPTGIFIGATAKEEHKKKLVQIALENTIPIFGAFVNADEQRFSIDYALID
jgi:hypothetical protein